ncbi:thermonuclease family protein [Sporolactobacillus shoreicorticis]|uniref:Thermonuclease family protein n=1 Tax=Sporolactobacillus shoreicorticis TaxID=1923877 RepID=A0ABW5RZQ5_9BACL|nr:thermonuclease family protein [Sporolactobacillus shoreicorticis]MCO7127629.1 thermonuclease family protein [Sporolactobacillus shoreicorticis]
MKKIDLNGHRGSHVLIMLFLSLILLSGCAELSGSETPSKAGQKSEAISNSDSIDSSSSIAASVGDSKIAVSKSKKPEHGVTAKVTKVVDGDTFQVLYQKKVTTVRVLLIDTPETHHPKLGVQPYGPEASAQAHRLLDGKTVTLELAKNGGRDKYGRLLAYVFVDGKSFESLQLAGGLARVAYVYPPNTKYIDQYQSVENQARAEKIGIWSVNGYAEANGFHPEVMKGTAAYDEIHKSSNQSSSTAVFENIGEGQTLPSQAGDCNGLIKGNISSRGKIYHMPSDRYYKVTKAEVCFKTRNAAVKAGFRAAK